jgi:tripartite-type tricarboxylate transporter receptor subunit TctC
MEELKQLSGMQILHVPYQGSSQAMNDLLAGTVQVAMDTVAVTRPHIDAGRMRLIATGSLERRPFFPDTPTIAEQGYPGFEANAWLGMLLPANPPRDMVERLATVLNRIVRTPEVQEKFQTVGTLPRPGTTAEFEAFLKAEYARWGKAIAQSGIRAD